MSILKKENNDEDKLSVSFLRSNEDNIELKLNPNKPAKFKLHRYFLTFAVAGGFLIFVSMKNFSVIITKNLIL